jgi:hypothetical protein
LITLGTAIELLNDWAAVMAGEKIDARLIDVLKLVQPSSVAIVPGNSSSCRSEIAGRGLACLAPLKMPSAVIHDVEKFTFVLGVHVLQGLNLEATTAGVAPFDFFCALYLKAVALCTHEESVQLYTNLDLRLIYPQARQYVSDGLDKHVIFTMANATARYNSVSQIAKAFRKHLTRIRNGLGDWEAFCAKCSQSRRRPIFRHLMSHSVRSTRRKVRVNNAFFHYINMSQSTAVGFQRFKLLEFAHNEMSRYFIILPPTDEHLKITGTARKDVICTFTQLLRECRLVGDTPSEFFVPDSFVTTW